MIFQHWQARLIQVLSIVGMLLSFYLLLFHNGSLFIVCGADSWIQRLFGIPIDCYNVSGPTALYSKVGPFPVALIGLVGNIAIFGAVWLADLVPALWRGLHWILLLLIGGALLFVGWLNWLEATRIHAFCEYCIYAAVNIVVMFVLAVSWLIKRRRAPAV